MNGHWPRALLRLLVAWFFAVLARPLCGEDFAVHSFARQQLTDVYYSEGIAAGDLNHDGQTDMVYGPYWFAGPDFKVKREIYPAKAQPKERYADHFFAWIYDFNGDGWNDVLVAGFPGTPAYVYENPQAKGHDSPWPKHQVLDSVSNESPQFVNLVGDEQPELVCTHAGFFGYATFDAKHPWEAWQFHDISEKIAPVPFGHGLGVGDVNGDGRVDVLMQNGWFQQPAKLDDGKWPLQAARFAPSGGAEMYAYDVDGDGDNDVITSLAAHEFGLAWHEQIKDGERIVFRQHLIMGDRPAQNRYGLVFSELHSVNLVDIDGDGLKDIVTGKTYWSHHQQSPMWDAGAVVYWFRLVRGKDGVDWVPYQADGEAGIGRQVIAYDINKDGQVDLASGGMKGAHILMHKRETVSPERWKELQPKPVAAAAKPPALRGKQPAFDEKSGRVAGALEGESLAVLKTSGGQAAVQKMDGFPDGRWSGDAQLFWNGAKPGDRLELELNVEKEGAYDVVATFTMARDYAVVQPLLDDAALGEPLDLYNYPDVFTTGELALGTKKLAAGKHHLTLEIKGANASAVKAYMVGLDYLRLAPTSSLATDIFAADAKPVLLQEHGAGEGPAWHPQVGLLTSGEDGHIHLRNRDGQTSILRKDAGSNGLLLDRDGSLVICEAAQRRVTRLDKDGKLTILADKYGGKRFNQPNDLTVDSRGRIYFSDPQYGDRSAMELVDDAGRKVEGVYRIDPDGKVERIITHEVDRPNGLVVSPDDKYLFVADNNNNTVGGARKLWRFDLRANGTVDPASRKLLYDWKTTRGPDGIKLDAAGRLFVAAGLNKPNPPYETQDQPTAGVYVISPAGERLAFVPIPRDETTNCAFGGDDLKTLFVTAGGALFSVRVNTPGGIVFGGPK